MIKFSKKYKPVFKLLKAREEAEQLSLSGLSVPDDIQNLLNVDTILVSGGRDSGKTFGIGCLSVLATADWNHRILYTRYTMSSTDNSITSALDNRMELLELEDEFEYANHDYRHKLSKGKISITGHKTSSGNQSAKLKSLEDYSMFITEEGEELPSYDEWKKIKLSIRAKDVQCLNIIVFNPPTKTHWLYSEFYEGVPEGYNGIIGNVMYIHTNYLDNGKENIAPQNWNEYERLRKVYEFYLNTPQDQRDKLPKKVIKEYKEYKNVILGSFRDNAEGVIFDYTIGDYVSSEYGDVIGADQGFTHPTAFVMVNVDKSAKKIYLKELFYKTNQTTSQIYNGVKDSCGKTRIWCDSAVPMFIHDLKVKGLNIKECKKPKITDSINAILDYDLIVDKDSINLQNELNNYKWSDKGKEEPIDAFNHAIDAFRYAVTHKLNEKISQVL